MLLLPRGNPVKEKINPGKVNLPDALGKLQTGTFTGYLRFLGRKGTGILLFEGGRLTAATFGGEGEGLVAYDAIARTFELALAGGAQLDIYRVSKDLAGRIRGMLGGKVLYQGQALELIDARHLLGVVRKERLKGCLRICSGERVVLIFFADGNPLGFFHDGATEMETTADIPDSVARLPGARVDVLTVGGEIEGDPGDLMDPIVLSSLWQKAGEMAARRGANR